MCGLAGAFFENSERTMKIVHHLNGCQQHRGPDETSEICDDWFTLGHTRLSINALGAGGKQPIFSLDQRWLVSFNGEIYNHRHLRDRFNLYGLGPSDGAVIPELISRYGTDSLSHLRGMYAFIAVDLHSQRVLAAVDPFGIKPLHWSKSRKGLVIASEPLPMLRFTDDPQVDTQAIATFLHRGALDNADSGILGINRIRPGTWLLFDSSGVVDEGPTYTAPELSVSSSWESAAQAFRNSVRDHMLSEVPIALLLSDGVDSTAIAVEIARTGHNVTALTVDLGGGLRSEMGAARETCAQLGINHIAINETPSDESIRHFLSAMQRPTVDGLNTHLVLAGVRQLGFSVAISGLGGDEMLTGYATRPELILNRIVNKTPLGFAAAIAAALSPGLTFQDARARLEGVSRDRNSNTASQFVSLQRQVWSASSVHEATGLIPKVWTPTRISKLIADPNFANNLSSAQIDLYLTGQLLPDADAFSMAHSVELRVPFIDVDFAQSIFSIPRRALGKARLVHSLKSHELNVALRRHKQGFSLPMEQWMLNGILTPAVVELSSPNAPIRNSIDEQFINSSLRAWKRHEIKWQRIWVLVVLNQWLGRLES
jgi:asparagine synthase (glutamine-hydrolysing)